MKSKMRAATGLLLLGAVVASGCVRATTGEVASRTIEVTMKENGTEMIFDPARIEVRRGDVVRFTQGGVVPHNVQFIRNSAPDGVDIGEYWSGPFLSQGGESYEVTVDERFADGTYEFNCMPHIAMGMTGEMVVSGGRPAAAPTAGGGSDRPEVVGEQGLQELEFEMDGAVKVFRLTAEKIRWETREGKLVDAMAYNRMVPGPVIRVREGEELMLVGDGPLGFVINGKEFPMIEPIQMRKGERLRIRMANLGGMYHPMHLHGGFFTVVAKDGFPLPAPQDMNTLSIGPGETFDVILHPQFGGTWIWHCHVLSHATGPRDDAGNETAAGMIAVVVVDDGNTAMVDMSNHTNH